jgi:hypothetical protein
VVDALPELAPLAEQERLKVLLPPTPMVIDSDPEVPFDPDQDPDAEQLVASVDDQVRVIEEFTSAESADAERVTEILGVGATGAEPPPPPPPPQVDISNKADRK